MNHSLPMHFWRERDDVRSALRSAGFLAAVKRGAHFIFQANPGQRLKWQLSLFGWIALHFFYPTLGWAFQNESSLKQKARRMKKCQFSDGYYRGGMSAASYRSELRHQLRKMTLGISVGLVKESPSLR